MQPLFGSLVYSINEVPKKMKLKHTLTLSLLFILAITAGSFAQAKRTINVSDFDGVNLGGSGIVYITQGSNYSVEFVGSDDLFEDMKFEVRSNKLNIGRKKSSSWSRSSGKYEVFITMPEIRDLSVSGSGRMIIEKTVSTDDLDLIVSGSGKMQIRVKASAVDVSISGSGEIEAIGEAKSLDASISGSGKVMGKNFTVSNVDARISGSGNVYVHATNSIESRISGSGSIYYSGEPSHINNNSSGSGKIKKM
jgi:hypothetical protein